MIQIPIPVPSDRIENRIFVIWGHRVMMDADLAEVYGVTTRRLNEQVKRNIGRFPEDFLFRLRGDEKIELVAKCDRFNRLKHSTVSPLAFTEHGAIMAASILNSARAIEAIERSDPIGIRDQADALALPIGDCNEALLKSMASAELLDADI